MPTRDVSPVPEKDYATEEGNMYLESHPPQHSLLLLALHHSRPANVGFPPQIIVCPPSTCSSPEYGTQT